ncbi:ABC transporter permease [Enterococcus hulanensis]|uniref:ABC transporter permease n=1 Tax=Enterococcus hulanensis TaxID=2559929 RepID=UPI001A8C09B8|nr:ABC transporter permease [Enterococcus hulanensis]MBO0459068.1 ABC transporter permease [Enterococcus hulanensis]
MIRSIYFERYKKVLIAACILIIGSCLFNVAIQNNQWKNAYNDPNDKQFYEEHKENLSSSWDNVEMKEVPFASYKDYRQEHLFFYTIGSPDSFYTQEGVTFEIISKASNYSKMFPYVSNFSYMSEAFLLLFVPLIGFLLFFIDQKTGFNQFLFSLGASRKELFKKKLLYIALPFLLSILVGQSLYVVLIHTLIPAPYMNATLGQLFTSVISNFCLLSFMFASSAFIGSMVGNIVFGPLTWSVYWWLMLNFPRSVYSVGNIIYTAKQITHKQFPETLFVSSVGKMGGHWWMNLLFILLGSLLMFWAFKKYQTISLENDNAYLLHKKSRWSIWGIMTLFTSFILNTSFFDPWLYFFSEKIYGQVDISISSPILSNITVTLIVGLICAFIIFFRGFTKTLTRALNKLNQRTG